MLSVSHNHWYRGSLEGIATQELARLLPWHKKLSWRMITYVAVYAKLHASANDRGTRHADPAEGLSKTALFGILTQLRFWVETLQLADTGKSVSGDCARSKPVRAPLKRPSAASLRNLPRPPSRTCFGLSAAIPATIARSRWRPEHGR
jgi:hypothetical protein